jgi:mRNA interferase RelE/StbE
MSWSVRFHREAEQDLRQLGTAEARRILKVIRERIAEGEPDKLGKPPRGILAGYRRFEQVMCALSTASTAPRSSWCCVGARRDDEVYETATRRV